jgi:hypothetical protein
MIKLKQKVYIGMIAVTTVFVGLLVLLFSAWIFHWETPRDKELKTAGNEIIVQIEAFKSEKGRLPENLKELGLPETEQGPIYYDKRKDGMYYTVSYSGASIGESTYYDSEDGVWHDF